MGDGYHHGNLRQALIDAGIKIINDSGESNLSLRKAAALCNVSHAAPYAHFKDKEELLKAIKDSVTCQFMEELTNAVDSGRTAEESLLLMGKAYVQFFIRKPDYFKFLFSSQNIVAHISDSQDCVDDYPPFLLLKDTYLKYLKDKKIRRSAKQKEIDIIKLWSTVHGLSSIACMSGVTTSIDWEAELSKDLLIY